MYDMCVLLEKQSLGRFCFGIVFLRTMVGIELMVYEQVHGGVQLMVDGDANCVGS
jgi:hypothetical protein